MKKTKVEEEKTTVVFRKWKNGDIIAIFPEEEGTTDKYTCACYEHVGQHGTCTPLDIVSITEYASPDQYESLENELKKLGYILNVKYKITSGMNKKRLAKYAALWHK